MVAIGTKSQKMRNWFSPDDLNTSTLTLGPDRITAKYREILKCNILAINLLKSRCQNSFFFSGTATMNCVLNKLSELNIRNSLSLTNV